MEFTKTKKERRADTAEEIRRRLLNWPDCYYREREPELRKAMLEEADRQGLTPEDNVIRHRLYEIRYPAKGDTKDAYLRAWLDMRFLTEKNSGGFFLRSPGPKRIEKILGPIGFSELDEGASYRNLLYQEVYHLGMLYASLCHEDKGYSSVIFGIGQLSDDKLARKIGAEFRDVAVRVPKTYGAGDSYRIWTEALTAAYCDLYPEYEHIFRAEEEE